MGVDAHVEGAVSVRKVSASESVCAVHDLLPADDVDEGRAVEGDVEGALHGRQQVLKTLPVPVPPVRAGKGGRPESAAIKELPVGVGVPLEDLSQHGLHVHGASAEGALRHCSRRELTVDPVGLLVAQAEGDEDGDDRSGAPPCDECPGAEVPAPHLLHRLVHPNVEGRAPRASAEVDAGGQRRRGVPPRTPGGRHGVHCPRQGEARLPTTSYGSLYWVIVSGVIVGEGSVATLLFYCGTGDVFSVAAAVLQ